FPSSCSCSYDSHITRHFSLVLTRATTCRSSFYWLLEGDGYPFVAVPELMNIMIYHKDSLSN
ncbi:MAG: hypothetical protein M3044_22325, partial [Thermoproteota archaeon]|nr:hypothetical protein [Thermoproteota archaeon]